LPPSLSFNLPLLRRLVDAERALGELAGFGRMLPNPHLLIGPFLRREAVLSSRIEGTVTRLRQLFLFEVRPEAEPEPADVTEVSNYVRALEYGLQRLKDLPVCLRLLREIHERLLEGVRGTDKKPGHFRDCQVIIGRHGQSLAEARYVPPLPGALNQLLRDFERFLNATTELPLVVQLALVHYQFEAIHPFMDGNGRIGRLLISLLLCQRGCLPQPLLYLSAYLERNNEAYRDHLLAVSQKGAWNEWIDFFAQGVAEQALDSIQRSRGLLDLWQKYRRRMQSVSQSSAVLRLVDELFASPVITISKAEQLLAISFRAAQLNIEKLQAEHVLKEITGKQRNRVYIAPEIMALLEEQEPPPDTAVAVAAGEAL
jgi:Fic family protein